MLGQRVITALVLLALLVPAMLARSPWPFAVLTLLMIGAAGWEWGRLSGASFAVALALGVVVAAVSYALCWFTAHRSSAPMWWGAAAAWVLGGALALRAGPSGWSRLPPWWRCVLGVLVLALGWTAIFQAHAIGVNFLLSTMALVWAADIAAYAGGRAFGKHKLAPTISPGKSWEGVLSGIFGALALAAMWITLDRRFGFDSPSLYSQLLDRVGGLGLVLAVLGLCAMSVVGDLFESLVKRAAGAKDSSGLLPGHGGVLDRIDALLPVLPIAMALGSL